MSKLLDRFAAFAFALEAFWKLRDEYREDAAGGPIPDRLKALSAAAERVLRAAVPFDACVAACRELGTTFESHESYDAALQEIAFVYDPAGYLKTFGTYSTEVGGAPVTMFEVGGQPCVIGDRDALVDCVGEDGIVGEAVSQ